MRAPLLFLLPNAFEAAAKIQWAAHLDNHTQIVPFFSVFVLCFLNSFVMIQPLVLYFT